MILSTGMANIGEIEVALEVIQKAGTPKKLITVLHCSTEYPTPMHEVNLRAMETIKTTFDVNIGYSDHTEGIEIPIASGTCAQLLKSTLHLTDVLLAQIIKRVLNLIN